jgi:hypothetical protein
MSDIPGEEPMSRLLLMAFLIYSSLPLLKAEEIFVLEKIEVIANKDISTKINFFRNNERIEKK